MSNLHFATLRVARQSAQVHKATTSRSAVIAELEVGENLEVGIDRKAEGLKWRRVLLRNGQAGWMADEKLEAIPRLRLTQESCSVFRIPSTDPEPCGSLRRGDQFVVVRVEKHDGKDWVRASDENGKELGFIEGATKASRIARQPDTIVFDVEEYRPFIIGVVVTEGIVLPVVSLLIWGHSSSIAWGIAAASWYLGVVSLFVFRRDGTVSNGAYAPTGLVGFIVSAVAGQAGILLARLFKQKGADDA